MNQDIQAEAAPLGETQILSGFDQNQSVMTSGAGSVYSLSQHHDRKKRKAERKARKMAESANKAEKSTTKVNTIVIQEANVEEENNTGRENCFKTLEGEDMKTF